MLHLLLIAILAALIEEIKKNDINTKQSITDFISNTCIGFFIGFILYDIFPKSVAICGAYLGSKNGQISANITWEIIKKFLEKTLGKVSMVTKIFNYATQTIDKILDSKLNNKSKRKRKYKKQVKHTDDFLQLMILLGIIQEDIAKKIIIIQFQEKLNDCNHRKVGQIYIDEFCNNKQLGTKMVNIILELQKDEDYKKAINKINLLKKEFNLKDNNNDKD
jgi:hypothetical protein